MKDFSALQSQVTKVDPKGVESSEYNPTNKAASCPPLTSSWQASDNLPPTPDAGLCSCMQASLSCVRASGLATKDYGDIFNFICGHNPGVCAGINGNATSGVYGAYSMCDDGAKLDYVLDTYYNSQKKASTACDFNSQAQVISAKPVATCSAALASASAINKQAATATAPVNAGATGGSSTSGDSTKSSSAAVAGRPAAYLLSMGEMSMALYMGVAMLTGASMILL